MIGGMRRSRGRAGLSGRSCTPALAGLALALGGCIGEAAPSAATTGPHGAGTLFVQADTAGPSQLLVTVALTSMDAGFDGPAYFAAAYGIEVSAEWPLPLLDVHCFVLDLPADRSPADISGQLAEDPNVTLVQPMNTFTVMTGDPSGANLTDLQHGLREIRAFDAHGLATGDGIRIGVVDTGVDGSHPDLAANATALRNFVGFTDPEPAPEVHGTAIAGVIGAAADDGYGLTGVAPNADIWGLRACWQPEGSPRGLCNSLSLARAVHFAVQNDLDVLNLSLQGPEDPLLQDLIDLALARGMVLVAARPPSEALFPASVEGVIAVTVGPWNDAPPPHDIGDVVLAPGTDILGPTPGDRFDYFTGSSLAAAHVTGIVALALERAPDLNGEDLAAFLLAANRRALSGERSGTVLDAHELLRSVLDHSGSAAPGT